MNSRVSGQCSHAADCVMNSQVSGQCSHAINNTLFAKNSYRQLMTSVDNV